MLFREEDIAGVFRFLYFLGRGVNCRGRGFMNFMGRSLVVGCR